MREAIQESGVPHIGIGSLRPNSEEGLLRNTMGHSWAGFSLNQSLHAFP